MYKANGFGRTRLGIQMDGISWSAVGWTSVHVVCNKLNIHRLKYGEPNWIYVNLHSAFAVGVG